MKLFKTIFTSSQSVFLGITCGLIFTFCLFIGMGTDKEIMLIIGGLFVTSLLIATNLLFAEKTKQEEQSV